MSPLSGLTVALLLAFGVPPQDPAAAWHRAAIVIDTHADTTQAMTYGGADIATPQPDLQLDLARAAAGGLDAQFFSIFVLPPRSKPDQYFADATRQIDAIESLAKANPGRFRIARTDADVRANAEAGVMSGLLGVEGGHALLPGDHKTQLEHLRTLAARGVRYLTLTWSNSNDIGGSSGDKGQGNGLTPFGAEVIKEMNRLGMVVDISHVSDATFWDAVRASKKPVLASHSSARALTNIPRNMTDDMLKAVAAQGGAVCVNFGSGFLDEEFRRKEEAIFAKPRTGGFADAWKQIRAEGAAARPQVVLDRLVDHIMYVAHVAGVEHTCLGSDFDGVPATPVGMEDVGKLPALTAALRARGLSRVDIEKILGGNVLRVLEANEPDPVDVGTSRSPPQVTAVVKAHFPQLKACYEAELRTAPTLKGKVVMFWQIEMDGRVSHVKVEQNTMNSRAIESCLAGVVQGWTFPSGDTVDVSFPFVFQSL